MKKFVLILGFAFALVPALAFADGSQSYTTGGTYTFTVPSNSTLTVQLWGAGGGGSINSGGGGGAYNTATFDSSSLPSTITVTVGAGGAGGANQTPGGAGGASSFGGYVAAYGGGGGAGYAGGGGGGGQSSAGGAPYCITENFGFCYAYSAGNGGDPSGGGGQAPSPYCTSPGNSTYGGGGGGNSTGGSSVYGGGGGGGGACGVGGGGNSTYGGGGGAPYFAYPHGSGSSYGSGGTGWNYAPAIGSSGTDGAVIITWTSTAPPPPTPTLTISADATTITLGQSTGIHATYTIGSGDTFIYTALNEVPPGGSESTILGYGPVSRYDYTFTPNTTGTYVFKPYAYTSAYPSWSTEGQSVSVTVVNSVAPTCSVTFSQNPIGYGQSTNLIYSSTNATSFYINNIGYVPASGSTTVGPLATTDYSGSVSGPGGSATCPASLTVTPPSPSATIVASPSSVIVGQSSTITANFAAGYGDTITQTTINIGSTSVIPYSAATTRTYTFTPATAGVTTFLAYAQTGYYPSWTVYAQTNVTATNPTPIITLTANGQYPILTIAQGSSYTLAWNSANASSCTMSWTGNPGGSSWTLSGSGGTGLVPGWYTFACTGPGGNSSVTVTINQSCTPAYSCSGNTIQHTDASCNVTPVTICSPPTFCQSGSSTCSAPAITVNNNLKISPALVQTGETVKVSWSVNNAQSCTVTGTNGDSWTGLSSPAGGETSSVLKGQTTYTLSCLGYSPNPNLTQSQTVNVAPVFQEF